MKRLTIRRQLTLFVKQEDAANIERIRKEFNPQQSELIKSHVTLCREDEIENIENVIANLSRLTQTQIIIDFDEAIRFDNGKGLLLPAKTDNCTFQTLRKQILSGVVDNPGIQKPHITLMHPRNSTCTDEIFEQIRNIFFPSKLVFETISLIEQTNDKPWRILKEFSLTNKKK